MFFKWSEDDFLRNCPHLRTCSARNSITAPLLFIRSPNSYCYGIVARISDLYTFAARCFAYKYSNLRDTGSHHQSTTQSRASVSCISIEVNVDGKPLSASKLFIIYSRALFRSFPQSLLRCRRVLQHTWPLHTHLTLQQFSLQYYGYLSQGWCD